MKRISLILFSLLLITVCAISFAEEAPWVTKENVREHSGYVWREEIPRYRALDGSQLSLKLATVFQHISLNYECQRLQISFASLPEHFVRLFDTM